MRTDTYHDIYKTIQGIEATHTTIFTKLFRGEKQHLPHYLQNHSGERPSTYHDIYKAIHEREPTLTTLFTKLFKGDSKHIYNIYKTI